MHFCSGHQWLRAALLAVGVLVPVTEAVALWDDRLELFAAQTVARDDNVFRISSHLDPAAVLGSPSKGDTYYTTSLGFKLDVPVSRQRFQASLAWNITRYDRFAVLNLDNGHDGRAAWLWQIGNELSGRLGYTDTLALASFANTQSGVSGGTPNVLRTQRATFDAAYQLTPRWRLSGEASRLKQSNGIAVFLANDVIIDGAELTVSYITPADNRVGLNMGVEESRFPNRQLVAGSFFDNAYRQQRVAVVTDWTVTGHSHVSARAGWVNRGHEQLPQRDFESATFHATFDWKPTGKLLLSAIAQRDISSLDDIDSRSVLVKSVALRPTLRLTEKVNLSGSFEYSDRDHLRDPGVVLGVAQPRTDRVRTAAVTVTYRPVRLVTLRLDLQRQTRSSTLAFGDYETNVISVSARLGF